MIHYWEAFLVSIKISFNKYWLWQKLPVFYLQKITLFWHFYAYTLSAPGCTWNIILSLFVKPILCRHSWVWILIDPPVKFLPRFLTCYTWKSHFSWFNCQGPMSLHFLRLSMKYQHNVLHKSWKLMIKAFQKWHESINFQKL